MSTEETRRDRGDETRKMAQMNAWLDEVCAEIGVPREVMTEVTPDLLRLVGRVAHGPSRPGAPLTAFVVGLAAGWTAGEDAADPAEMADGVRARIAAIDALLSRWQERA